MVMACHCEGKGWKFWGDSNVKSKFWGQTIQLDPVGVLSVEFDDGEIFQWSKVNILCFIFTEPFIMQCVICIIFIY
jgi:hypothetical protein